MSKKTVITLVLIAAAAGVAAVPWLRRQHERYRMKVTVTHIAQLGRMCAVTKPRTTDCAEIIRMASVRLGPDTCLDGWGKPIGIRATNDQDGNPHYVLTADGPGRGATPAFVWSDGSWQKIMPGTPP